MLSERDTDEFKRWYAAATLNHDDGSACYTAWMAGVVYARTAALRDAHPKIDGVPTVPGWYWARSSWRGWMCVEVRAELNGGELGFYGWGYVEEAQPLDLLKDYHGPLTPPKETT